MGAYLPGWLYAEMVTRLSQQTNLSSQWVRFLSNKKKNNLKINCTRAVQFLKYSQSTETGNLQHLQPKLN